MVNTTTDNNVAITLDSSAQEENKNVQLTRKNILACKDISLTDSVKDVNLHMYCSSVKVANNTKSSLLRECRGLVFDGDTLISKGLPFNEEYTSKDLDSLTKTLGQVLTKSKIYDSHEGTLIRVFFYKGRWRIITHRKLNAFKSRWASQTTFGKMFVDALYHEVTRSESLKNNPGLVFDKGEAEFMNSFLETLPKGDQYLFLVRNMNENRIVSNAPDKPTMYHVATLKGGEMTLDLDTCVGIPHPVKHEFESIDSLAEHVDSVLPSEGQGVIVFTPCGRIIKVFNPEYEYYFNLRGNEPSIRFRYLQVRMSNNDNGSMYTLYPEAVEMFEQIENNIYQVAKVLTSLYKQRYIEYARNEDGTRKTNIHLPREEYQVLKKCHTWHIEDRTANRVNLQKVITVLNEQPVVSLNRILKRYVASVTSPRFSPSATQNQEKEHGEALHHVEPLDLTK